jgi:hypothetical protein
MPEHFSICCSLSHVNSVLRHDTSTAGHKEANFHSAVNQEDAHPSSSAFGSCSSMGITSRRSQFAAWSIPSWALPPSSGSGSPATAMVIGAGQPEGRLCVRESAVLHYHKAAGDMDLSGHELDSNKCAEGNSGRALSVRRSFKSLVPRMTMRISLSWTSFTSRKAG